MAAFGYCGSLSNTVSANLRIDSTGIRFHVAADVDVTINPGSTKLVTFSVIVPKNVGYSSIPWGTLIPDSAALDYAGWVTDNKLVSTTATTTTTSLYSSGSDIATPTQIVTDPASTLFYTFELSYTLHNIHATDHRRVQKVIAGFTYDVPTPTIGQARFDIYPSVVIS